MKTSKQTTSEQKSPQKAPSKKGTRKTLYLAIAACIVALVVTIPFLGKGGATPSGTLTTLPLGLLLESSSGALTVVQATQDATSFGILRGDIIRSVDETSVNSVASFRKALEAKQSGDTINVVVQRGDAMLTINRRYRGKLEVPSEIGAVYEPSLVKTSNEHVDSRSTVNVETVGRDNGSQLIEETKVIAREWADFGLRFSEDGGRLVVTSVKPSSVSAAYGVAPQDILFQLDSQKITSLTDFHRVAAEKFVGDTASLMLIRGENIVLLRDMVLGSSVGNVSRPEGYEPAIYPFASLEKEALERLLTNPFEQELSIPAGGFVPPAPEQDALVQDSVLQQPEIDAEQEMSDLTLPYTEESAALDPADTGETAYAQTSPDSPQITELAESRRPSNTRVRRFSDVEDVTNVAEPTSKFPKPNATPRFNKYSSIRLPNNEYDRSDDQRLSAADGTPMESTEEQHDAEGVEEFGATFYDGVRTDSVPTHVDEFADQVAESAPSQAVPLTDSLASQPDVPFSPFAETQLTSPSSVLPSGEAPNPYAREGVFDQYPSQVAERVYDSNRLDGSRTLETGLNPGTEQPMPGSAVAHDHVGPQPVGIQHPQIIDGPLPHLTHQASVPSEGIAAAEVVQSQPYELSQSRPLSVQPNCQSCGDWGCDQCTWKSHNEKFSINHLLYGDCTPTVSIGGWFSAGYHSSSNDLFNSRPDEIGLHQSWLFAEKLATDESPIGFRADLMYGIDANDTQAFGNDIGNWDFQNGFDHGSYGWAIPQLYLEVSLGEWNIKAGHFFTTVGYEVVTAPDNFFYSHAITMYNSEPFTHTGILASRMIGENLEIYAGWTLGWDTGFDQFGDGGSWLGGFSYAATEDIRFTYMSTAGDFGARGDDAYSHSMVANLALTDQLTWIVQSDYLRVNGTGEDNVGLNQYLLYEVNEKLGVGTRLEWWKGDVLTGYAPHGGVLPAAGSLSYYAATFGVNYQPRSNVIVRPEVRYDWSPAASYDEAYVGLDAILRF